MSWCSLFLVCLSAGIAAFLGTGAEAAPNPIPSIMMPIGDGWCPEFNTDAVPANVTLLPVPPGIDGLLVSRLDYVTNRVVFAAPGKGAMVAMDVVSWTQAGQRAGLWPHDSDANRYFGGCVGFIDQGKVVTVTSSQIFKVDINSAFPAEPKTINLDFETLIFKSCIQPKDSMNMFVGGRAGAYMIDLHTMSLAKKVDLPMPISFIVTMPDPAHLAMIGGCSFASFEAGTPVNCTLFTFLTNKPDTTQTLDLETTPGATRIVATETTMVFGAVSTATRGAVLERDGTIWWWPWDDPTAESIKVKLDFELEASGDANFLSPGTHGLQAAVADAVQEIVYVSVSRPRDPSGQTVSPFIYAVDAKTWTILGKTNMTTVCERFDECILVGLVLSADGQILMGTSQDPQSNLAGNSVFKIATSTLRGNSIFSPDTANLLQFAPTAGWFKFIVPDKKNQRAYVIGEKIPVGVLEYSVADDIELTKSFSTDVWGPSHIAAALDEQMRVYVCDSVVNRMITLNIENEMAPEGSPQFFPCSQMLQYDETENVLVGLDSMFVARMKGVTKDNEQLSFPSADILSAIAGPDANAADFFVTAGVVNTKKVGVKNSDAAYLYGILSNQTADFLFSVDISAGLKSSKFKVNMRSWNHPNPRSIVYDSVRDRLFITNDTAITRFKRNPEAPPKDSASSSSSAASDYQPYIEDKTLVLTQLNGNYTRASSGVLDEPAGVGYFFGLATHVVVVCLESMKEIGLLIVSNPDEPAVFELRTGYVNQRNGMIMFAGRDPMIFYANPIVREQIVAKSKELKPWHIVLITLSILLVTIVAIVGGIFYYRRHHEGGSGRYSSLGRNQSSMGGNTQFADTETALGDYHEEENQPLRLLDDEE